MESFLDKDFTVVKAKRSSDETLQIWRGICKVVKNPKRRFRFTANLAKREEAAAMRRTNQGKVEDKLELQTTKGEAEPLKTHSRPWAISLRNGWNNIKGKAKPWAKSLRNGWNNIKGKAKPLLKNTWTEIKKILTSYLFFSLFALGMEVASATVEEISSATDEQYLKTTNHKKFYLMALLAAVFSFLGLVQALLEMIHYARSSRRWINWTVQCVNIVFAFAQTTTSLVHFIFLQFYRKIDPIKFSFLPVLFALIIVVSRFITHHQPDTIEGQLVCGDQTYNVIVEKIDGNYEFRCTSTIHEPC